MSTPESHIKTQNIGHLFPRWCISGSFCYCKFTRNFADEPLIYFNLQIEIKTFKKFGAIYRPLMVSLEEELCKHLLFKDHPLFEFFYLQSINGTLLDPCPLSVRVQNVLQNLVSECVFLNANSFLLQRNRYDAPRPTSLWAPTILPTGEWRLDVMLFKVINDVEELIFKNSYFAEIKAKSACEFQCFILVPSFGLLRLLKEMLCRYSASNSSKLCIQI